MKITGVETFAISGPGRRCHPPWLLIKLLTDTDLVGYGEAYWVPFSAATIKSMIEDMVAHVCAGEDPRRIEALWNKMYIHSHTHYPDYARLSVITAIEMACWDILGKECGKPVYALLGGSVRSKLRSYTYHDASLISKVPDVARRYAEAKTGDDYARIDVECALDCLSQGFTACKIDPLVFARDDEFEVHLPLLLTRETLDIAELRIRRMREAVGAKMDILIGTHGQMSRDGAIRLAKRLEPFEPMWFEEPVPPENVKEMALVARATTIPIASGERLATKWDFQRMLEENAASILQFDMGRVGGILEAKKIAAMAEAKYCHIAPHMWGGPFIAAASIQIDMCCLNFLIQEGHGTWDGMHAEILKEPIKWENGFIIPSARPGLGYELNEEVARRHSLFHQSDQGLS